MKVEKFAENGPVLFHPTVHGDERGFFLETFRQNEFEEQCGHYIFVQDNHSRSHQYVLRGLHYQLYHPQGKLVRVIAGQVLDLVVDLRRSSPTFGKHFSAMLSAENKDMFWVPPGFAHGFLVMSEIAEFVYKCTEYYHPEEEHSLLYNDPALGITWPAPTDKLSLSAKDKAGLYFADCPKFS